MVQVQDRRWSYRRISGKLCWKVKFKTILWAPRTATEQSRPLVHDVISKNVVTLEKVSFSPENDF